MAGLQPQDVVNQITWQVGSLKQVVDGGLLDAKRRGADLPHGRDMPGSNWHTYMQRPGEQPERALLRHGADRLEALRKPLPMHNRGFDQVAELPQIPEFKEVEHAFAQASISCPASQREKLPLDYQVNGILMPRPFKIIGLGPIRLIANDVQKVANSIPTGWDSTSPKR